MASRRCGTRLRLPSAPLLPVLRLLTLPLLPTASLGGGGMPCRPSTTSADPGATARAAAVAATVLFSPSMGCSLAQSAPLHPA